MTISQGKMEQLENPEDPYNICCVLCGARNDLCLIPHRVENGVSGLIVSCSECRPKLYGGNVAVHTNEEGGN